MKRPLTALVACLISASALAQNPQIPTLQVCNGTKANGTATVHLTARQDISHTGDFTVRIDGLGCDPIAGDGFPAGTIGMSFSLSDSSATAVTVTSIEQLTTTGKHTPTMYLNGRCKATTSNGSIPCHFWLMLVDNKPSTANTGTPDVVGVLVVDKTGKRITYGTGPVTRGDIDVVDTAN
jgi:hypothetical protein